MVGDTCGQRGSLHRYEAKFREPRTTSALASACVKTFLVFRLLSGDLIDISDFHRLRPRRGVSGVILPF
jgi:hypothetical protein